MSIRLSRLAGLSGTCCVLIVIAATLPAHAQKVRALPPTPAPNMTVQTLPNPAGLPSPMPFPAGIPAPATPNAAAMGSPVTIPPSDTEVAPANRTQGSTYSRVQAMPSSQPPSGPYTAVQIAQSFLGADLNRDGELTRAEAQRLTLMPRSFEEMDRNFDGVLSRSEYEDAFR